MAFEITAGGIITGVIGNIIYFILMLSISKIKIPAISQDKAIMLMIFFWLIANSILAIIHKNALLTVFGFLPTCYAVTYFTFKKNQNYIKALEQLVSQKKIIGQLKNLHNGHPEHIKWKRKIGIALEKLFGDNSKQKREFEMIIWAPLISTATKQDCIDVYIAGLKRAEALLESFIDEYEIYKT